MANNVKFLRGQSSALSTLTAPSDGVFYLATDTKKLNVGLQNADGTTSVYELNKDITVYSKLSVLEAEYKDTKPKKSSFFYLEEENIFCIYTGTGFAQINPDTGMTGIEDKRSSELDSDGYNFASQPITSLNYDPITRKLMVNSADKFVTVATFKDLVKVVEDNKIIGGVSSEFAITNDDEKILSINSIDQSKVTGLSDALAGKVDKQSSMVEQVDGSFKEVEWTLMSPTDQAKLAALVIGENGSGVEISGKVNASNVDGLATWIENSRSIVKGLMTAEQETKLAGIAANAQVNIVEAVKLNNIALNITDKAVNIPLASATSPGVVVSSSAENHVAVKNDGTMTVNSLNVNKLVQSTDEMLIIYGGDTIA